MCRNVEQSGSDIAYGTIPGFPRRGTGKAQNTSIVIFGVFDADYHRGMAAAACQT
jgi:hypothetical protein